MVSAGLGPDERPGASVVLADIASDGLLEVGYGVEHASPQALPS